MMWKLKDRDKKSSKELRKVFVETLEDMMEEDPKVIALEADLGGASGFNKIKDNHPRQFVDVGIAEANMIGVAAGLSMRGFIPYVHTFSPFASRRIADQVYLSGAYSKNTVNIYGSDPGICAAVTFENHNIYNGLGSAVAEIIAEQRQQIPLKRIGVKDQFGQVGSLEYLKEVYGLTAVNIVETVRCSLGYTDWF